jgi:hypothetical protein
MKVTGDQVVSERHETVHRFGAGHRDADPDRVLGHIPQASLIELEILARETVLVAVGRRRMIAIASTNISRRSRNAGQPAPMTC